MKALNRAIGRTVSQLARYGAEGCHPPMLMALENHLDALLTMERKQLEVAGIKVARIGDKEVVNITNVGCTGSQQAKAVAAHILRGLERTKAPEGMVAFSTPQEKNGSLFDRFVANGMMEQDGFREHSVPVEPGNASIEACCGNYETCQKACVPRGIEIGRKQVLEEQAAERTTEQTDVEANAAKVLAGMTAPAPDVIDMTDPRNWQAKDWIVCKRKSSFGSWELGTAYQFGGKEGDESVPAVLDAIGNRIPFRYDQLSIFFTWLRHGEAQA